jgi:hypothetical protein
VKLFLLGSTVEAEELLHSPSEPVKSDLKIEISTDPEKKKTKVTGLSRGHAHVPAYIGH